MNRYLLTPAADLDIEEIWQYVAGVSGNEAADRVESDLHDAMALIAGSPGIGHTRPDLADESLRIHTVHSYLIVYRPETSPIHVVRVIHGARDVESVLGPG
jgi:antitoxin ParD1/3/4/toxin ParE1/3/4